MNKIIATMAFITMLSFSSFANTSEEEKIINVEYQNTIEINASGIGYKKDNTVISIGCEIPVTVHYDNTYLTHNGKEIKLNDIKITDEGVPIAYTTVKEVWSGDRAIVNKTIRYKTFDGEEVEINGYLLYHVFPDGTHDITNELLGELEDDNNLKKHKIASIEVWIYQ